jgi:uncharacterized protein YgbK (DUF1537 family)
MSDLLLCYYADDFTGATDALECLELAGLRTALFIKAPTPEQLVEYPDVRAVGVAGMTRAMGADEIEAELRRAFSAIRQLDARHVHYKVCSTFDSSPTMGSIGRAIDVGASVFCGTFVPVVVGAPTLGRYCVFGNLFARMGIGSAGDIYRLDRHPSMSRHPVTPADESDVRIHLARQTSKSIALFDVLDFELPADDAHARLAAKVAAGNDVVVFDALYAAHIKRIGGLLDSYASAEQPFFSVGSSSIESAISFQWQRLAKPRLNWPSLPAASPTLIACGSCSPVTIGQIEWARDNGFEQIVLNPDSKQNDTLIDATAMECVRRMKDGANVVLHTDAAINSSRRADVPWGDLLGCAVRRTLESLHVERVCVCGGDTSSHAARSLGILSLEFVAPLTPGAPLCRARAPGSPADGVEFVFKGGQVGAVDYFGVVARGGV